VRQRLAAYLNFPPSGQEEKVKSTPQPLWLLVDLDTYGQSGWRQEVASLKAGGRTSTANTEHYATGLNIWTLF